MHLRVVNPNTTETMTATIERAARAVVAPGTALDAVTSPYGPVSIESYYDEALAVPGVLAAIAAGEADGVDGYVLACFGDPGLDAAREAARGPVVGIAEAAMHAASFLGRSFSVVTTVARARGGIEDLAARYGFAGKCAGVHASDLPVLALETDPAAGEIVQRACSAALAADGSDVVVLGCAGMADLAARISATIGVPVVEGVAAATVLLQGLVTLGLRTSAVGEYAAPPAKPYTGMLRAFGSEPAAIRLA